MNERDNGMQGLHGMLRLRQWTNSGRESSEGVKISYALIGRNGSQFARPARWPICIVEWTSGGDRDFAHGRFFENSKSQKLNGLCVNTTTEYK